MQNLIYSCEETQLHRELQTVWREQEASTEADIFKKRKSVFYGLKFILFVIMSVLGIRHYNIMGML